MEVYALCEPHTTNIRYVGITEKLEQRLHGHFSSIPKSNRHSACWLRKIKSLGQQPNVLTIESGLNRDDAGEREKFWISYYRKLGYDLTNASIGGEHNSGWKCPHTPQAKEKIRKSLLGNTRSLGSRRPLAAIEATRQKNIGKKRTSAQRETMSRAQTGLTHKVDQAFCDSRVGMLGKSHTEETKQNMRHPHRTYRFITRKRSCSSITGVVKNKI